MEEKTLTFEELQDKYREEHSQLLEIRHMLADKTVYTENPYSFNIFLTHAQYGKGQFTIRTRPGEDGGQFLWRIKGMLTKAAEMGWQPEARPVPAPHLAPVATPAPTTALAPAPNGGNGGTTQQGVQVFPCKVLACTITDGKAFWKIKGGHFEKWGVAVYSEVLEPAGFVNLDPLKQYDMAGWTATYSLKDDGKPWKVTKLAKG